MKLTEINKIILGEVELEKSARYKQLPDYTDKIAEALEIGNGIYNKRHLTETRSHTEFYEHNPLFEAAIDDWNKDKDKREFKKELFYAMLCETYIPHVPTELVALFVLTRRVSETPNKMILALDRSKMKRYLTQVTTDSNKVMKDLLDEVWGYDVNLLTENRRMVNNKGVMEIYIENIDDVLLCNPTITSILRDAEDVSKLTYDKDKGVLVGENGIPLRVLIQSFGITRNDLDLRSMFLVDES